MTPGMRYFRVAEISHLLNQMVRLFCLRCVLRTASFCRALPQPLPNSLQLAIKDYEGVEVNDPGLLDGLRSDAAVAESEMLSSYQDYVRLRCAAMLRGALTRDSSHVLRCRIWRSARTRTPLLLQRSTSSCPCGLRQLLPMTTGAPYLSRHSVFMIRLLLSWCALGCMNLFPLQLTPSFVCLQASMDHAGSLSANALAAMLQEQPAQAVITMHADGSETWDGPLADELRSRVDVVAAGLIAEGDARSAALTGSPEEKAAQLWAQMQELSAKVEAGEARCEAYRRQIAEARADEYLMMQQCKEEFSGELWPMFTQLRAKSLARLAAEAEARPAAADAATPASEAAAAAAALDALAIARAEQFEDAREGDEPLTAAPPAALVPGEVGDAFFNDADDEEAVAELERQASAKLRRMDLPATIARVRARIAGADPLVQSCLGAVFTGFGAPGTEEEGAVRTVLTYAARELETAIAEREAAEE